MRKIIAGVVVALAIFGVAGTARAEDFGPINGPATVDPGNPTSYSDQDVCLVLNQATGEGQRRYSYARCNINDAADISVPAVATAHAVRIHVPKYVCSRHKIWVPAIRHGHRTRIRVRNCWWQ